jgi:hypothetical protein
MRHDSDPMPAFISWEVEEVTSGEEMTKNEAGTAGDASNQSSLPYQHVLPDSKGSHHDRKPFGERQAFPSRTILHSTTSS